MDLQWKRARTLLLAHIASNETVNQTTVAEALDVTQSWVSQFLAGTRDITRVDVLVRLAGLLGTPVEELLPPALRAHLIRESRSGAQQTTPGDVAVRASEWLDDNARERLRQLALDLFEILGGSAPQSRRQTK